MLIRIEDNKTIPVKGRQAVRHATFSLLLFAAFAVASCYAAATVRQAQSQNEARALTNDSIIQMLHAGLAPEIIVAKIKSSPCEFDTSPVVLESLKKEGVPDSVVVAMVQAPITSPASSDSLRPRVYVTNSQSWSIAGWSESHGSISTDATGKVSGSSNGFGFTRGGARPQTAEIIKTLNQKCPEIIVTDIPGKADYALLLDHEGGKGLLRHRNKVAVFDKNGDDIFSDSTLTLGGSVEGACEAIRKNIAANRPAK